MKKELIAQLLMLASNETVIGTSTFYNHLHKWPDKGHGLEDVLTQGLINTHRKFKTDTSENKDKPHSINLFSTAQTIGSFLNTAIFGFQENTPAKLRKEVQAGVAVIDVLINLEALKMLRGRYFNAPYVLLQGPTWEQLISELSPTALITSAISYTKPKPIDDYVSPITKKKVVKRGPTKSDFERMKGSTFLAGCDVLQQTGWRINQDVLQAVREHVWMHEGPDGELVATDKNEVVPNEGCPVEVAELLQIAKQNPDDKEAARAHDEASIRWSVKQDVVSRQSRLSDKENIVKTAEALKDQKAFYYAIEADYRGRIYYGHPTLHYQGADLAKGLLEFSEGVVLNSSGMRWLLIHAACCYNAMVGGKSVDKLSIEDREQWSIDNMKYIKRVAKGKIIDYDAENPFMFLAACLEIVEAKKCWAPNVNVPFVSHLPLPIDGSNNGSQHCAAITRDPLTALQVGMTKTKVPTDLYNNVGGKVVEFLPDFFTLHPLTEQEVRKNIAKRACMVRGYSAGAGSIASNMFDDCYKNGITKKYGVTYNDCTILSKVCISAINEVCPSIQTVQKYLQELVKFEIGKFTMDKETKEWSLAYGNGGKDISWTTPSGFIVRVLKTTWKDMDVNVKIQGKGRCLIGRWMTERASIRGHVSGVAANVIHSMDASHMVKTAVHFEGGSFAGVHDSFAVHANYVDDLVKVVKEEFIAMYEGNDFYDYIKNEIVSDQTDLKLETPEQGNYDLNELRESNFFFC